MYVCMWVYVYICICMYNFKFKHTVSIIKKKKATENHIVSSCSHILGENKGITTITFPKPQALDTL